MTAPNLVLLKQPGDAVSMIVERCGKLAMGKYPEVEFAGTDGPRPITVRMPEKSAERQLIRLDLDYATVVGKIITISRSASDDPAKPYWNVSLIGAAPANGSSAGGEARSQSQPAPVSATPAPTDDRSAALKSMIRLHEICFTQALRLAKAAEKEEIVISSDAISALTAQLFIAANDKGIV